MRNILITIVILVLVGCANAKKDNELGYQGRQNNKAIETLESLKNDSNVTFRIVQQWTIANKNTDTEKVVWSFTPKNHEAFPSVVRRAVKKKKNGEVFLVTNVRCGASKATCDRLVQEFIKLNNKVKNSVNAQ